MQEPEKAPAAAEVATPAEAGAATTVPEKIAELVAKKEKGMLTDEEFASSKKAVLLGSATAAIKKEDFDEDDEDVAAGGGSSSSGADGGGSDVGGSGGGGGGGEAAAEAVEDSPVTPSGSSENLSALTKPVSELTAEEKAVLYKQAATKFNIKQKDCIKFLEAKVRFSDAPAGFDVGGVLGRLPHGRWSCCSSSLYTHLLLLILLLLLLLLPCGQPFAPNGARSCAAPVATRLPLCAANPRLPPHPTPGAPWRPRRG